MDNTIKNYINSTNSITIMKFNPYLEVLLAATIGGSSGIFIRYLDLPVTTITFFRLFIPALILFIYLKWKKVKLFRRNIKLMLLGSSLNAARLFLFIMAYMYTSIANGVIILFTWPIFAAIFSILILKEKVNWKTLGLILLAFVGIIMMYINKEFSFTNKDFVGMTLMLVSAICLAFVIIIFKEVLKENDNIETVFYQNIVGAVVFIPFIFINFPKPTIPQIGLGAGYGILCGMVTFILFFSALKRLKVAVYSLLCYWEVVAGIFFGFLFFKEIITWNMFVGGACIILSSLLIRKNAEKKQCKVT